jgi:catechol 2,3-dioxygenase-like lactoylglutathione lyase family enzyme
MAFDMVRPVELGDQMDHDALAVIGAMHCNLNVVDVSAAAGVYESLGLVAKMKSPAVGQDGTGLGIPGPTDSEAWFFYDHRGGRAAPAVELVEWSDPVTTGTVYPDPTHMGMWALGFDVPDAEAAAGAIGAAGGTSCAERPAGVDAAMRDTDGVALELTTAPVEATTFRYARLSCASLEATAAFYARLGFALGPVQTTTWQRPTGPEQVQEQTAVLGGAVPLELRLVQWAAPTTTVAHSAANHRGLFRMAFAVPDVAAAIVAARSADVSVSDAFWIPLPGTPLGGLNVAFLIDPDGVMVEFVERKLG